MDAIQNLEDLVKHSGVFRRTKDDSFGIFMSFLKEKVSEKTGKEKVTAGSIADDCGFPHNVFSFNRYTNYDMKPDKLSKIARTYNFDLNETVELFEYFGLCLTTFNEPGKSLLGDQEIPGDLKKKIGTKEYINCLFAAVRKKELYTLADCNIFYPENRELINSGQLDKAYEKFTKYIESAGNEHLWRVQLDADYRKQHHRETLFEIGYLCAFSLEEIKELYRSQGYLFAPKYIKFDAFVNFIMNYDKERYNYAFYKSVCSNIDTKYEKYERTEPEFGALLRELGILDEYHYPSEMERDQ